MVVNPATGHRAISPLIYGINDDTSTDPNFAANLSGMNPSLVRLGGNRWTAYNWVDNLSNAGSDYQYENDNYLSSSTAPGAAVLPTVQADEARGATTLVTVPVNGYVASVATVGSVENTPNYMQALFKVEEPGTAATATAPLDPSGSVVYQNQFVTWLMNAAPNAKVMFSLDNEPDLWNTTHSEIHPSATTYAEILHDDLSYAEAIHAVDPNALITGPVSYGYEGYVNFQQAPDSSNDGNFLDWYLAQVKAADAAAGYRVLSDLDLHWYPAATGGGGSITDTGTSPAESSAREQAPRSLWDPSYVENSWITQCCTNPVTNGSAIDLIPTIKSQIASNDPGTNLAFSEWNYGGGQDISGGIATADVLGIFGAQGVHAAGWWPLNSVETFSRAAFSVFRNYDGNDSTFGDTEVTSTTSDPVNTSVYGSVDSSNPNHVVIVAINKNTSTTVASLQLAGSFSTGHASVYTLTGAGPAVEPAGSISATNANTFTYAMPAQSVSVIVPAPADTAPALYADTPPGSAPLDVPYSYTFGATGTPTPTFTLVSGALPDGLSLNSSTGVLAGTPNTPGTSTFAVAASNGVIPAATSAPITLTVPAPPATPQHGYWLVGSDGGIFTYGSAQFFGSTGSLQLQRPVAGITPTGDRRGYWLVASDGGIFSFGDAGFYGSIPGLGLAPAGTPGAVRKLNAPIVGMVPSGDGGGYFMVAADGGVFAFGDARFEGSCPGIGGCSGAAVAVMPDANQNGYWLVTATGHVYSFGDAASRGAPGPQSSVITSAARTPSGNGYWMVDGNGQIFGYGDATPFGQLPTNSTGGLDPATAIFTTSDGGGGWISSALGQVFTLGDAPSDGDMAGTHLNGPIIAGSGY